MCSDLVGVVNTNVEMWVQVSHYYHVIDVKTWDRKRQVRFFGPLFEIDTTYRPGVEFRGGCYLLWGACLVSYTAGLSSTVMNMC